MKIALGTTSGDKLDILRNSLTKLGLSGFEIILCLVESGIPEQPIGEKVIKKGSQNRAKNALTAHPDASLGVGMEAGLISTSEKELSLVCACTAITRNGQMKTSLSNRVVIPSSVSDRIRAGEQFGMAIREHKDARIIRGASTDEIKLIDSLISRRPYFEEAIIGAITSHIEYNEQQPTS